MEESGSAGAPARTSPPLDPPRPSTPPTLAESLESISLDAAGGLVGSQRSADRASRSVEDVVEAILGSLDELASTR